MYFENVLNGGRKDWIELQTDQTVLPNNNEEAEAEEAGLTPSELKEIIKAIQNLKSSKATGEDTITAELLKNAGRECQLKIYNLILKIWQSETMLEKWKNGLIVPIHKKGSRSECANYRLKLCSM